jgi:uncharacterized protein YndB with AHSA1/START domain
MDRRIFMKKIFKEIVVDTSREVMWAAVINDNKYKLWTSVFDEGSYFEGGWQKGDKIRFLTQNEKGQSIGMVSEIAQSDHLEFISIRHLGYIENGVEDFTSDAVKKWAPSYENYRLEELESGKTRFSVEMDIEDEQFELFDRLWTKALEKLKEVCEKNLGAFAPITVEALVDAPLSTVWDYWITPEHVMKWNFASDDWYCPSAENDLRKGGRYNYRMAAKNGSMAFDFGGTYTEVVLNERIVSQLDDGRMVHVVFSSPSGNSTKVTETFEAETLNSLELQKGGWQSILNNFKAAAEKNQP